MRPLICGALIVIALLLLIGSVQAHGHRRPQTACKAVISEAGDQWVALFGDETLARSAADKAWRQHVRAEYGEQYTDLEYAREARYRCAPAGLGGFMMRCDLTARPCRVPAF